jgi:hypothetical protein
MHAGAEGGLWSTKWELTHSSKCLHLLTRLLEVGSVRLSAEFASDHALPCALRQAAAAAEAARARELQQQKDREEEEAGELHADSSHGAADQRLGSGPSSSSAVAGRPSSPCGSASFTQVPPGPVPRPITLQPSSGAPLTKSLVFSQYWGAMGQAAGLGRYFPDP